jgi:threonine synthase
MRKDGLALTTATPALAAGFGCATGLGCREGGSTYPLGPVHACIECFGPLEVTSELPPLSRETIEGGPASMWRYAALLPVPAPPDDHLAPGFTPLVRADRLGRALGMRRLWVKDDRANPTHSFKDRVVAVAFTAGRALGFDTFACASTGNLANAVASAAARVGVRAVVFVPHDLEAGKIVATAVYGATLVAVEGSYDDVNRLCSEVAGEQPWGFVNVNLRPFYAEGSKTLGFEAAEQLGWRLPDHVVVPIASGALLTKIHRAFQELIAIGAVEEKAYRVSGAQPEGCRPVAQAFQDGAEEVRPVKPDTIARSLAIGAPADGYFALQVARETGGAIEWCTEAEILDGIRLLASTEGVFTETAGGVTIANLRRLVDQGVIRPDEEVVAFVTGNGFKTVEAFESTVEPSFHVAPDLDEFLAALHR